MSALRLPFLSVLFALPLLSPFASASVSQPSESLQIAVEIVADSLKQSGEAFAPLQEMLVTEPDLELELVLSTAAGSLDAMGVALESASESLADLPPYEGADFALAAEAMADAGTSAHLAAAAFEDGDLAAAAAALDELVGTLSSLLGSARQNASAALADALNQLLAALANVRAQASLLAGVADGGGVTLAFEELLATLSLPADELDAFSYDVQAAVGGPLEPFLYLDQPHFLDAAAHAAEFAADPSVKAWVAQASIPGWLARHIAVVLAMRLVEVGNTCTTCGPLLTSGFAYLLAGPCKDKCYWNSDCGPCQMGGMKVGTAGATPEELENMQSFLSALMSAHHLPGVHIPSLTIPGVASGIEAGIAVFIDHQRMLSPSVFVQACWQECISHMCWLFSRQRTCDDKNTWLLVSPPSGGWDPMPAWTPAYANNVIKPACQKAVDKFCEGH